MIVSAKIQPDGRIRIPAAMRRAMNLKAGKHFSAQIRDGELILTRIKSPAETA